jgi:hypothetical protein
MPKGKLEGRGAQNYDEQEQTWSTTDDSPDERVQIHGQIHAENG